MSSSDRPAPSRDRPESKKAPRDSGRAGMHDAPVEPPQYFDPSDPWDPQAADALARHYETGEGYLHRRPEDAQPRRCSPPQDDAPAATSTEGSVQTRDTAWLEARLAEIAERLQSSLTEINPGKEVAELNQRLGAIEERFHEALGQVVKRSDIDGLKLIEAHVMELAAHVEETRGQADRIDAIDKQVQSLARQDAGDTKRLDALEKLLQDYVVEWRKGDQRTASSLQNLEGVIGRLGESIEAMEAHKPAPDLALAMLDPTHLGASAIENDPLSQVYADAARVLEPTSHRGLLDAADYAPQVETGAAADMAGLAPSLAEGLDTADAGRGKAAGDLVPSPSFLVSMMRKAMRQARGERDTSHPMRQAGGKASEARPVSGSTTSARRRPHIFLMGGLTVFAAVGYLLVDIMMSGTSQRPAGMDHSAAPPVGEGTTVTSARIEAIGSALAATFRTPDAAPPSIEATASIHKDAPSAPNEVTTFVPAQPITSLPMSIGPASLRQGAMRGDPAAQLEIAARFATGQGVERDLKQALQWYGRAATQGLATAQYRLAALYERGLGTTQDIERARVWYARAAEQGNIKAMHNLAVIGAARSDYATAAKWFTLAADFGLTDSQVNLAVLFQSGLGVPKDLTRAYKWLALAVRSGDQEAAARLSQVKARLSLAELEAADAMLAAWRARTPEAGANDTLASAASLEMSQ